MLRAAEVCMSEHGLTEAAGWTKGTFFACGDVENFCGSCNHTEKVIWIKSMAIDKLNPAFIHELILHEIAHALVGPNHGHDNVWSDKAMEIGGHPELFHALNQGCEEESK